MQGRLFGTDKCRSQRATRGILAIAGDAVLGKDPFAPGRVPGFWWGFGCPLRRWCRLRAPEVQTNSWWLGTLPVEDLVGQILNLVTAQGTTELFRPRRHASPWVASRDIELHIVLKGSIDGDFLATGPHIFNVQWWVDAS